MPVPHLPEFPSFCVLELSAPCCHPKYKDILLCPRATAVPQVYRFMRDSFGSVYNSFLCLHLPAAREGETPHAIFWMSLDPDNYSEESVRLVAAFRPLLLDVSRRLSAEREPVSLAMIDEGTVNLSAESLLRRCKGLRKTMDQVDAVADTHATILIHGASGVGKELFAEAIHALSPVRHGPLVRVNCGAMTESLMDSELFGHEKGAFTGAATAHAGFFEQARGGTLFLDEVGELSPPAQLRLLRVLESGEIRRVGGSRNIPVDVRVISATHRNLWDMVRRGLFREDLLFRLEVFTIEVPSLGERHEDIPLLAEHFYHSAVRTQGLESPPLLTGEFMMSLQSLSWPGNVRQLRHAVERAVILGHAAKTVFSPSLPKMRRALSSLIFPKSPDEEDLLLHLPIRKEFVPLCFLPATEYRAAAARRPCWVCRRVRCENICGYSASPCQDRTATKAGKSRKKFPHAKWQSFLQRQWKIERLFAWPYKLKTAITHWKHCAERYAGLAYLAFSMILLCRIIKTAL